MKIHLGTEAIENIKNAVVTSGTFDGVHMGHQKIIDRLKEEARRIDGETVLITYWPHPRLVLKPWDSSLQLLSTFPEKANLLEEYGIDHLVKVPFTKEFASMQAEDYIRVILSERIQTKKIIIGYDHRFGKDRSGGLEELHQFSDKYGYEVEEIPRQDIEEIGISSTKIRRALEVGDVQQANTFLGRNYAITGRVVHGEKIGRSLGFPTANISIKENYKLIPADGIYAVRVCLKYNKFDGMLNIGNRPTIGGDHKTIEVNIFDFNEDIYESEISIEFVDLIRKEIKFSSLDALKEQLKIDKQSVTERLSKL
ncbi:MAG: bifunctional riboflavin kinase/FAD synthetase [Roseivirga sp.]|uniref:bifunctional riboflavin kinase/FAD synthetase n=1 Tax=Roseivirga sp. TaxID=1964215 RepID=UPI001B273EEA|nr:bifunctional riboflavin kinase/FAD synthetase [Roseivirga sp.]MBO6659524.1 bifunctional riboflavin kinase/FAD synthetase [Roseivirga sp.]MBO6907739.1 bifunctional riboflavin kinase/FAD synthetase [Roseivirga sp.]